MPGRIPGRIPGLFVRASILSLLLLTASAAQAARDGFQPELSDYASLPLHSVDGATPAALAASPAGRRHQPLRFAVRVASQLGLADGRWDFPDTATARWRLRLHSAGAVDLAVEFAKLKLPAGAALYLYDPQGTLVQGPVTASEVPADGRYWSPLVPGDEALIEVRTTPATRKQVQLQLAGIDHAFRPLATTSAATSQAAASCEVNVACPVGDNWGDQIRAVALISIGNQYACSAELVNNVRQDDTPYLLTAHHCSITSSGSTAASSVVAYWNYQSTLCAGGVGNLADNQSGSTLIATDAGSDFTLVRLNQSPPSAYKVYFGGWYVGSNAPQSGVAIHHPQAGIKKISSFTTPAERATVQLQNETNSGTQTVETWQVQWSQGITESGSSGAALWNQDQRIVGVLSGGTTACASGTSSTGYDYFGRLEVAWTAQPDASGQLKATLDPDNTGASCIDGKDPGGSDGAVNACTSSSGGGSSGGSSGSSGGSNSGGGGGGAPAPLLLLGLAAAALIRRRG